MIWKDMWEEMWLYGNPLSPFTRVSYNQTVLSLKYHGAFYISVAGFRITMPCLTHFNSEHTFQHMTKNASMLVLSGKRMHSA